jgi:hypothetical protein
MHYFIRVCLEVPICGVSDPFLWGVWVSLSRKIFDRYVESYDAPDTTDQYFGFFCNYIPVYQNTYALKTEVHPRDGNNRPFIVLEETDHPLSVDFRCGITIQKAQEIAEQVMHRQSGAQSQPE